MKKISLVTLGLLAANTLFAQTSPLSYDYVAASLGTGDIYTDDYSYYGVNGSYSITDNFFVKGSWYDGATDDDIYFGVGVGSSKVELSGYDFGAGFHTPVTDKMDLVASVSFVATEVELFGLSQNFDGYGIDAGVRMKATERLELNLLGAYVDQEDDAETGFTAAAYYFLTPTFSVGVVYTENDENDTAAANVRLHF